MKQLIHKGFLVSFVDGLGHPKEMIYLLEREYQANDAAARLHGTCTPLYKVVEDGQTALVKES